MLCETIRMREDDANVILRTFVADNSDELKTPPRPAILVFPGGGYSHHSPREAEPVAMQFFAAGFQAFILNYSVQENAVFPRPLHDAARAMAHIRANAERYNIDPARIFVLGFSAGGHLAASVGTMYAEDFAAYPGMEAGVNRPAGMILCYPVLTYGEYAHRGSYNRILGVADADEQQRRTLSPEAFVSGHTVPAYIWHTASDRGVPVQNSILFASAMAQAGVPCEMHIFPRGGHGTALCTAETSGGREDFILPEASQWIDEAIAWALRVGEEAAR